MTTLGWLSDIHLDATSGTTRMAFLLELASAPVDAWLLGGDIDVAPALAASLESLDAVIDKPVYFVLGNHDYYGASLAAVRARTRTLVRRSRRLTWLTDTGVIQFGNDAALVDDDGWGDARFGDPVGSDLELTDFYVIQDIAGLDRQDRIAALNRLGDEAAARLGPKLHEAAASNRLVVVLTHVPPFPEATWYAGRPADDSGLPWFSCKAVGDVILECAREYSGCEFLVLCGHTHHEAECQPARNVTVLTAGADYGSPRIEALLDVTLGTWKQGP